MRSWTPSVLAWLALATGTSGVARADDPRGFRLVVRVPQEPEALLFKRVTAHLSDLPVSAVAAVHPLEGSFSQQLAAAATMAARDQARAVMWLDQVEPNPGRARLYVYIGDPPGRLVRRRIVARPSSEAERGAGLRAPRPGLGRTTLVEIAAIMARSTMQELLAGAVVGVPSAEVEVEAAAPDPEPAPGRPALLAMGRLGWQPAALATNLVVPIGLALGLELGLGRWRFGVAFSGTTPSRLADDLAEIELARLIGGILVRREVVQFSWFALQLGGQAGIAGFRRATVGSAQGTVRTDTRTTYTPAFAPEVLLRLGPFGRDRLAVVLGVGADVVPGRPTIAYDLAGTVSPAHRLWAIQPRTHLSLELVLAKL